MSVYHAEMICSGVFNLVSSRRVALAAIACVCALATAGCGSSGEVDTYLVDFAPFGTSDVDTDLIFPREQGGSSRFLVRNWPPQRTLEGDTMWIHGTWARVRFFHVADAPASLVVEATPYSIPNAPQQTMTVELNGTSVAVLPMRPEWQTYEIDLPSDATEIGWNQLELIFEHSLRPSDFDPQSNNRTEVTAGFRHLEIRGALGRPHWPGRPEQIVLSELPDAATTVTDEAPDRASLVIEMPTDSVFEVYMAPVRGTELSGAVDVEFADPGAGGEIHAVIDVVDGDAATRVWEGTLTTEAAGEASVHADLSPWRDRIVSVRVRVYGSANGMARWKRLGTSTPAGNNPLVPASLAEVVAPPSSGLLDKPDIFVVLLDAARADAFDGSRDPDLTPNVRSLADEGTSFTEAWSPSSWTGQSIPAIFTGMNTGAIGAEHWGSQLPPAASTLPELLLDAGYHTVLWSQHNIYRPRAPLRFGFDRFNEVRSEVQENREILPAASDMLVDDRPTFAFIHLLPPHDPYLPPEPFAGSRSGWYSGDFEITPELLNRLEEQVPEDQRDEVRRYVISLYEENVRFADHLIGRLVEDLRGAGRYDDAVFIVIADHGEAFGEHGDFLHTRSLFEELLHVPFVAKWPAGFEGYEKLVDKPVSLIDLAPTLIDLLGIEDERARYQGRSLVPLLTGGDSPDRLIFAETRGVTIPETPARPSSAVRWNDLKLIYDLPSGTKSLFRLSEDPGETTDLAAQMKLEAGLLAQVVQLTRTRNAKVLFDYGGARSEELDEETLQRLRALGYIR